MENLVRSAPDQQTFEVADSAGAHDDHSGPTFLRLFEDLDGH